MASVSWISPPRPGRGPVDGVEDGRGQHVAAHDAQVRRRLLRRGLLDEVVDPDQGLRRPARRRRTRTSEISAGRDLLEGEDRGAVPLVGGQHAGQDPRLLVHDVVAEQDHEGLVADVVPGPSTRRGRDRAARPGGRSGCWPGRRWRASRPARSCLPVCSRWYSSSNDRSKWSSRLPLAPPGDDQDVGDPVAGPPPRPRTGWPACRRGAASPWAGPWWRAGTGCRGRRPGSPLS